jgi:hypothetical protein
VTEPAPGWADLVNECLATNPEDRCAHVWLRLCGFVSTPVLLASHHTPNSATHTHTSRCHVCHVPSVTGRNLQAHLQAAGGPTGADAASEQAGQETQRQQPSRAWSRRAARHLPRLSVG